MRRKRTNDSDGFHQWFTEQYGQPPKFIGFDADIIRKTISAGRDAEYVERTIAFYNAQRTAALRGWNAAIKFMEGRKK